MSAIFGKDYILFQRKKHHDDLKGEEGVFKKFLSLPFPPR